MSSPPAPTRALFTHTPLLILTQPHVDERGRIQELLSLERGCDLQVITSSAGALRGNHRHRQGWHFTYLVSGALEYIEERAGLEPGHWPIAPGQMFYTPAGVAHAMRFAADSVMVVIADRRRDQAEYEADLERVALV